MDFAAGARCPFQGVILGYMISVCLILLVLALIMWCLSALFTVKCEVAVSPFVINDYGSGGVGVLFFEVIKHPASRTVSPTDFSFHWQIMPPLFLWCSDGGFLSPIPSPFNWGSSVCKEVITFPQLFIYLFIQCFYISMGTCLFILGGL